MSFHAKVERKVLQMEFECIQMAGREGGHVISENLEMCNIDMGIEGYYNHACRQLRATELFGLFVISRGWNKLELQVGGQHNIGCITSCVYMEEEEIGQLHAYPLCSLNNGAMD